MRLSGAGEEFWYAQDVVAASGVGTVRQAVKATLASMSEESDELFFAWCKQGEVSWRVGREELVCGALWSGRRPVHADVDHAVVDVITFDRDDFERRAACWSGFSEFALPDLVQLPRPSHAELLNAQFSAMRQHQLADEVVENPLLWQTSQDQTVAAVLVAAGPDGAEPRGHALPASVRRAIGYIDYNLDRPITLADVAAASRMSARGLQDAFQRAVGETPTARLRRGRLARARDDLARADPSTTTVAAVARRWGFQHLGRFAGYYRKVYGELPAQTLRR